MRLEGQQLGEFEILELLGEGGMGAVYKARQTSLDRFVAIKTLQFDLAGDASFIARFRQEAKAAALLNHPNLVQVYSAGETEGLHWFAMEYVEGESVKALLKRKGRLNPRDAFAITLHVAAALEHAWRKASLIHRDVKPDNIFLSMEGEVKLGDLGLAKSLTRNQEVTMTGMSMGTPSYMSPEQVEGKREIDFRTDIYSLGCTLYHLLGGQAPYSAESAMGVMMKHVHSPPPDLRGIWPECPPAVASAVLKMVQKEPAHRQQSYEEVSDELRRAYEAIETGSGASLEATQLSVRARPKSGSSTAKWLVGALMLCAIAGAVFFFAPWKKGAAFATIAVYVGQVQAQILRHGLLPSSTSINPARPFVENKTPAATAAPAPTMKPLRPFIPQPTARPMKVTTPMPTAQPVRTPAPTPRPTPTMQPARTPTPMPIVQPARTPAPTPPPSFQLARTPVPTPSIQATPTRTPLLGFQPVDTSTMNLIVDAHFTRGRSGFIVADDNRWRLAELKQDGEYQMMCRAGGTWWPPEPTLEPLHLKDFVCEIWARTIRAENKGGWGLGFIGGTPPGQPWSGVQINGSGQISSFHPSHKGDLPWVTTSAMRPWQVNGVRVEAFGPRIRVFVNGSFVFERPHERQTPDCGLALYLFGDNPPEEIRLRSVQVWTPRGK